MEAIVLAGGLGTRLREQVSDVPKPMAPVCGRPFLEFLLHYWRTQGVERFVLSVGYLHSHIQTYFGKNFEGAEIVYSVEEQPLGTGGALHLALPHLATSRPYLVLNGDTYFTVSAQELFAFHEAKEAVVTLSLVARDPAERFGGVELNADGRVKNFTARPSKGNPLLVNGGVYLFDPGAFPENSLSGVEPSSLERDLFPRWLSEENPIYGKTFDVPFLDIGVPQDYQAAAQLLNPNPHLSRRKSHAS